jgi:hypothetical protein
MLLLVFLSSILIACNSAPTEDPPPTQENDLVFIPGGRTFNDSLTVEIQTGIEGATIYYTTDGTKPAPASGVGSVYV